MISILFLSAEPTDTVRLRLGEEVREIQERLQLAKSRDNFILHQKFSIRPIDISQALLDSNPNIVHFSGHGTAKGEICVEDKTGKMYPIEPEALSSLFEQFADQINCVILNACYSEIQAQSIGKHVEYVIGMKKSISDRAAIAFSVGFYQALGASRNIEDSYKLGCVQMRIEGIDEHLTPILIKKHTANTPIPQDVIKTKKIALWGPHGSGKTTFQAMLYRMALSSTSKWTFRPYDEESVETSINNLEMIMGGSFPPSTKPDGVHVYRYVFWLKDKDIKTDDESRFEQWFSGFFPKTDEPNDALKHQAVIEYADISGESYLTEPIDNPVWEYLSTSDAIICLLDPMQAKDNILITFKFLENLWLKQKKSSSLLNGQLPQYFAFCFTKMDMPDIVKYIDKPRELISYLDSKINLDIDRLLLQYILPDRLKYFTISAIGLNAKKESQLNFEPREIYSINIFQPLLWLFHMMNMIYSSDNKNLPE
jgi:hypothetical protein